MNSKNDNDPTRREAICIDCRTALVGEGPCDGGIHHRVTSLREEKGRERLRAEVWGPPSVRRRAKELAKAGGSGATLGAALESCSGLDCACSCVDVGGLGELGVVLLVVVVAGIVFVAAYYLVAKIVEAVRRYRNRPKPHGAFRQPERGRVNLRARGRVVAKEGRVAALDGQATIGYGLTLRCRRFLRSDLMLRDGAVADFEILLDDGRTLQVPAGRVRVEVKPGRGRALEREAVEAYLRGLDPLREGQADGEFDLTPFDEARQITLHADERVEVRVFADTIALPDEAASAYRQAAPTALVVVGVPTIRVMQG